MSEESATKSDERLLKSGARGGGHLWIKNNVLHLQVSKVMHPMLALIIGKPIHIVSTARGKKIMFIRAKDFIEEFPEKAEPVKQIAKRFGADL